MGHAGNPAAAIAACIQHGFDGIEGQLPSSSRERQDFKTALADHGLNYIAEICTAGSYVPDRQATVCEHFDLLLRQAEAALECSPLFLTVIAAAMRGASTKASSFSARRLLSAVILKSPPVFETHRSRSFFNPWITRDILRQLPELKLTCDFSHWCVVCERLIDTEPEIIALCAERAHHIHARVGYSQGPQVPHPAAPEFREALEAHEHWWTQIWRSQVARGVSVSTMTPEFGPDGYLQCLPFTGVPVADLEQINTWMADRQRRRYAEWISDANQLNLVPINIA